MSDSNSRDIRTEFSSSTFRKIMKDNLSNKCVGCGTTENITYHHILPVAFGGRNNLDNIAPMCPRCHKAAHYGQHIRKYSNKVGTGRKPKADLTKENEDILWKWAMGEIGTYECCRSLGLGKSTKLKDTAIYRKFKAKHNIANIRNTRDVIVKNGHLRDTSLVSIIEREDGTRQAFGYSGDAMTWKNYEHNI